MPGRARYEENGAAPPRQKWRIRVVNGESSAPGCDRCWLSSAVPYWPSVTASGKVASPAGHCLRAGQVTHHVALGGAVPVLSPSEVDRARPMALEQYKVWLR